jgi:type I restriction enzyme M protein
MDTAEYKHVVQSEKFLVGHGGRIGEIAIYGQESNPTTWMLAKINLAIRSIYAQITHCSTFHNDRHPNLKGPCPALFFGAQL